MTLTYHKNGVIYKMEVRKDMVMKNVSYMYARGWMLTNV